MKKKVEFHGSDIEEVSSFYNIPIDDIVCFGANVNPLGLSETLKSKLAENLDLITSYPDRNYTALKNVIAQYCGISPEYVIVGNGSTELISLFMQTRKPEKALVLSPTYSEYGRELSLNGGVQYDYYLDSATDFRLNLDDFCRKIESGYDLVIICNPNNPTSSALTTDEIRTILNTCRKCSSFLMIDETYVEFAPDIDSISSMSLIKDWDNLMILRGVSKFYAAPGLRLGYGATSNALFLEQLQSMQNPWSLNHLGAFAGEVMLTDKDYFKQTRDLILSERDHMMQELGNIQDLKAYPAYANFILVQILKENVSSSEVFEFLIKDGLMVRDCSSFSHLNGDFFRFCIMNPEQNNRLIRKLKEFFK